MIVLGILLAAEGFFVWKAAALGKNSIDGYIKKKYPLYNGCVQHSAESMLFGNNAYVQRRLAYRT